MGSVLTRNGVNSNWLFFRANLKLLEFYLTFNLTSNGYL